MKIKEYYGAGDLSTAGVWRWFLVSDVVDIDAAFDEVNRHVPKGEHHPEASSICASKPLVGYYSTNVVTLLDGPSWLVGVPYRTKQGRTL